MEECKTKKLTCQRCNHSWEYKGDNPYRTTCPYCGTTVMIPRECEAVDKTK